MILESDRIFLDTEVFIRKNFDFVSHLFSSWKKAIDRGDVSIYLTKIFIDETKKHISLTGGPVLP